MKSKKIGEVYLHTRGLRRKKIGEVFQMVVSEVGFVKEEAAKKVKAEACMVSTYMEGIKNSESCLSKAYLKKKILSAKRSLEYLEQFCEEE